MTSKNHPDLWKCKIPSPGSDSHKYTRGHAVIYAAPLLTGATRLAAEACARTGAGIVSVLAAEKADLYRAVLPAHLLVQENVMWDDARVSARLYGSGGMVKGVVIRTNKPAVLDADAIAKRPEHLHDRIVLTPHEGEFEKNFPDIRGSKEEKARVAAHKTGAIIVLKGAQTVIAHPDGQVVINDHASPYLATAGSGDVLAGMITGFLAQGVEPFWAACAAVWIHGDAALKIGRGVVASDLPDWIPVVLKELDA